MFVEVEELEELEVQEEESLLAGVDVVEMVVAVMYSCKADSDLARALRVLTRVPVLVARLLVRRLARAVVRVPIVIPTKVLTVQAEVTSRALHRRLKIWRRHLDLGRIIPTFSTGSSSSSTNTKQLWSASRPCLASRTDVGCCNRKQ